MARRKSSVRDPQWDGSLPQGIDSTPRGRDPHEGGGGTRNSGDYSPTNNYGDSVIPTYLQNSIDANFSDVLNRITKSGNSDDELLNLLNKFGIDQKAGLKPEQRDDWNHQLLTTLLSYILEKDKRAYNESTLNEQRIYDSPTNQLARLMGAGISRDAALQLLGEGSVPIQTEGISAAEGIAPSQSALNGMQRALAPVQTALQAIGCVGNLVSLGFSIPQAILQTNLLQAQNYMSQQQIAAFNGVNAVTNAIQTGLDAGILSQDDVDGWSNANDVQRWMSDHADTNLVAPLAASGAIQSAFGSTIGREMFNNHWKQMRESRDAGTVWDEYVRQQRLNTLVQQLNTEKISAEIANIDADTFFKDAETQEVFARICLIDAQTEGQNLVNQGQEYSNGMLRMEFELNKSGFPMLKDCYLNELKDEVTKWSLINDPDTRAKRMTTWIKEEDNKYEAAWLEAIRLKAAGNFRAQFPGLMEMADAFSYCGAGNAFNQVTNASGNMLSGLWEGAKEIATLFAK